MFEKQKEYIWTIIGIVFFGVCALYFVQQLVKIEKSLVLKKSYEID